MLFIPLTKKQTRQLFDASKDLGASECVFWPVVDMVFSAPAELESSYLRKDTKERVTTYNDDRYGSVRVYDIMAAELLASSHSNSGVVDSHLDSIAFYKRGESNWALCYIPHENMAITKLDDTSSILEKHGLTYSQKPPDNW